MTSCPRWAKEVEIACLVREPLDALRVVGDGDWLGGLAVLQASVEVMARDSGEGLYREGDYHLLRGGCA